MLAGNLELQSRCIFASDPGCPWQRMIQNGMAQKQWCVTQVFNDTVNLPASEPLPFDPPLPSPPQLKKDPITAFRDPLQESSESPPPPLLKSLLDCARVADTDPVLAAKSPIQIWKLASNLGDPTEWVVFSFSEALVHRLISKGVKMKESVTSCSSSFDFSSKDFTFQQSSQCRLHLLQIHLPHRKSSEIER